MQSEDTVDTSVSDDNYADMNEDENATTDTAVVLVPYNQVSRQTAEIGGLLH